MGLPLRGMIRPFQEWRIIKDHGYIAKKRKSKIKKILSRI